MKPAAITPYNAYAKNIKMKDLLNWSNSSDATRPKTANVNYQRVRWAWGSMNLNAHRSFAETMSQESIDSNFDFSWEIWGYKAPITKHANKIKHGSMKRQRNISYLDDLVKEKKQIPAPTKYIKVRDWTKNYRGKFKRAKKVTLMAEITKRYRKTPGPMTYKPIKEKKHWRTETSKTIKNSRMTEICLLAKETPGVGKYNLKNVWSASLEKHSYHTRIRPLPANHEWWSIRPSKSKNPGPSDYYVAESLSKTKLRKTFWFRVYNIAYHQFCNAVHCNSNTEEAHWRSPTHQSIPSPEQVCKSLPFLWN